MGNSKHLLRLLGTIGALMLWSCEVKRIERTPIVSSDTIIVGSRQVVETDFFVIDESLEQEKEKIQETIKEITLDKRILTVCDSLNGIKELTNQNDGEFINSLIRRTPYPPKSHYCGITVNYIYNKVGIKHGVHEFGRASAWFKDLTKVIYVKGVWKTLERELKLGYAAGMSFDKNRDISHIGLFIKNIDDANVRTFEGNTLNPYNVKQQGFYYKQRKQNILWIRKF